MLSAPLCFRAPLLPDEVVSFPHCVVEVKLRLEQPPAWIEQLIHSGDGKTCLQDIKLISHARVVIKKAADFCLHFFGLA